jgi:hypothetical protein
MNNIAVFRDIAQRVGVVASFELSEATEVLSRSVLCIVRFSSMELPYAVNKYEYADIPAKRVNFIVCLRRQQIHIRLIASDGNT